MPEQIDPVVAELQKRIFEGIDALQHGNTKLPVSNFTLSQIRGIAYNCSRDIVTEFGEEHNYLFGVGINPDNSLNIIMVSHTDAAEAKHLFIQLLNGGFGKGDSGGLDPRKWVGLTQGEERIPCTYMHKDVEYIVHFDMGTDEDGNYIGVKDVKLKPMCGDEML